MLRFTDMNYAPNKKGGGPAMWRRISHHEVVIFRMNSIKLYFIVSIGIRGWENILVQECRSEPKNLNIHSRLEWGENFIDLLSDNQSFETDSKRRKTSTNLIAKFFCFSCRANENRFLICRRGFMLKHCLMFNVSILNNALFCKSKHYPNLIKN